MYPTFRALVLLLVLLPLASAVLVPLFGRFARRAALVSALLHVGLTAAVVVGAVTAMEVRNEPPAPARETGTVRLEPAVVPGDPTPSPPPLAGTAPSPPGTAGAALTNPAPPLPGSGAAGPITFSLPDLMGNVQEWLRRAGDAAAAGRPADLEPRHNLQFWLFV